MDKLNQSMFELNRFNINANKNLEQDLHALLLKRDKTFGAYSVLFYEKPLHIVKTEDVWLYDSSGKRYLDALNNVPAVGHGNPEVAAAIAEQTAVLNTNTRFLYDNIHEYAEKLLATLPKEINNIVFTCTGSESNDLALQIINDNTGGNGFIVTENAYHGNTWAVRDISPSSYIGIKEVPKHVITIPAPDESKGLATDFARNVEKAIADFAKRNIKFGGLIVDTIFTSDGIFVDPAGFLKPALDVVHKNNGLFVADEVQPGFGRTGDAMWGFERHGIVPDIVTMGKPMGNGYPVGGLAIKSSLLDSFCEQTHYFNTYGGNPVAAAAGLAVLNIIQRDGIIAHAKESGAYLRAKLAKVAEKFPQISAIRGAGLFNAAEFSDLNTKEPDPILTKKVINSLRNNGVVISTSGLKGNVLKIRPPLTFNKEHADIFAAALEKTLAEVI